MKHIWQYFKLALVLLFFLIIIAVIGRCGAEGSRDPFRGVEDVF